MSFFHPVATDLYAYWQKLACLPAGSWLFNRIIRFINPYTGALGANVVDMQRGYCRLELRDRRAIRNHLHSIHAIALTNMGEFVSGLALLSLLPENMRGIPVDIHIEFLKKARGRLSAESSTQIPSFTDSTEHLVTADIRNEQHEIVAVIQVKWMLSYKQEEARV